MTLPNIASQSNESCKRKRTAFSDKDREALEDVYRQSPFIGFDSVSRLSEFLGLPPKTVQIWFQNRRARARRQTKSDPAQRVLVSDGQPSWGSPSNCSPAQMMYHESILLWPTCSTMMLPTTLGSMSSKDAALTTEAQEEPSLPLTCKEETGDVDQENIDKTSKRQFEDATNTTFKCLNTKRISERGLVDPNGPEGKKIVEQDKIMRQIPLTATENAPVQDHDTSFSLINFDYNSPSSVMREWTTHTLMKDHEKEKQDCQKPAPPRPILLQQHQRQRNYQQIQPEDEEQQRCPIFSEDVSGIERNVEMEEIDNTVETHEKQSKKFDIIFAAPSNITVKRRTLIPVFKKTENTRLENHDSSSKPHMLNEQQQRRRNPRRCQQRKEQQRWHRSSEDVAVKEKSAEKDKTDSVETHKKQSIEVKLILAAPSDITIKGHAPVLKHLASSLENHDSSFKRSHQQIRKKRIIYKEQIFRKTASPGLSLRKKMNDKVRLKQQEQKRLQKKLQEEQQRCILPNSTSVAITLPAAANRTTIDAITLPATNQTTIDAITLPATNRTTTIDAITLPATNRTTTIDAITLPAANRTTTIDAISSEHVSEMEEEQESEEETRQSDVGCTDTQKATTLDTDQRSPRDDEEAEEGDHLNTKDSIFVGDIPDDVSIMLLSYA